MARFAYSYVQNLIVYAVPSSGVPGMTPAKYHLTGKFETAVQPMSADKQTLIEPVIDVVDGQTIMSFTKLLVEDGEIMVSTGNNIFLWAHGSDMENTYHGQNKGSFNINLLKSGSNHSGDASDSVEVRNEVIDKPTNRPTMKTTVKSTPKPSNKGTSKPSIVRNRVFHFRVVICLLSHTCF